MLIEEVEENGYWEVSCNVISLGDINKYVFGSSV